MDFVKNKSAFFHYEVIDTLVAGMVLQGWQVKSIRAGHAHLKSGWIKIKDDGIFLVNMHISPWPYSQEVQETKEIKLLIHKKEQEKLQRQIDEKNLTLIPLKIFSQKRHIKCEMALAKGKKLFEKKEALKERTQKRETQQLLKNFNNRVR